MNKRHAQDSGDSSPHSKKGTEETEVPLDVTTKEPSKEEITYPSVSYWSLFKYADRWDIMSMIIGTLGAIVNGAGMPIFAIIFGNVINDFGTLQNDYGALTTKINQTVPLFVYVGLGAFVGAYCQGFFWTTTSVRQVNRMRAVYMRHVLHQDIAYFDTVGTSGFLLQGLNEDCITIQAAIGDKVAMFLFFMSTAVTGIIVALVRGWDMALVILSLLPILGAAGYALTIIISRMTNKMNRAYADAGSLAQQALGNVRTVYAFNGEERTLKDYDEALAAPTRVGIRQGFLSGATLGLVNCIAFMAYALALWYGAKRVYEGAYDGAKVLTVLFSALIGGFALGQAAPNVQYFQQGRASAGRLFSILARRPSIEVDAPGEEPKEVDGALEFRDITFAYPSRPDKPVFEGFSLKVPAGKTVALVGESGSGKSTVIQLIERFYDPQAGAVLLDGIDLRRLRLRWLRDQMGLVSQEPTLFATTIKQNILFGRPGASDEEVQAAVRAANAALFIEALPKGYDTHVGEKGVQISGGQKQRIAIARAMLKNPKVLLLDEATSALDSESERIVQDALDKLMVGRTTVVVAHRLSTVVHSDSIAVVKRGKIVEQGAHAELLQLGGVYATLVHMQQSAGSSEAPAPAAHVRSSLDLEAASMKSAHSGSVTTVTAQAREPGTLGEVVVEGLNALGKDGTKAMGVAAPVAAPARMASGWRRFLSVKRRAEAPSVDSTPAKGSVEGAEPPVKAGFFRLAALNKPELPAVIGGLLGATGMGMLFPLFAITLSSLIALFYKPLDQIMSGARTWALVFMGIGFLSLFAAAVQSFCFNFMGQRLGMRVRLMMMGALLRQEVGWYDDERNSSGILTSKLAADAIAVRGQFGDTMGLLTQNVVTIIAAYVIAGINSWRMMLVVTATMPLMIFSTVVHTKLMLNASNEEENSFATANATASEAFSAARTVAAFGMENQVSSLYEHSLQEPTKDARKRANFGGLGFGFSQLILFGIYSLSFWYMGLEISNQYSSFESALKAFFSIFLAAFGLAQAQAYFPDVAKGGAAVQRVFRVIDRKSAIDASDPGGLRPTKVSGKIELQSVTFCYPQRPDAPVFENFNLTVPAGKTVALVGESGSGKSTVVSLIERFYDPQSGAVLLDGVDIRTLNLHWLRANIGLVGQEPVLFNMTVVDNIRYGRPQATLEEVVAAAKAANAHTFIEALPEGYHTKLGEGAIQLSGGQKQRVAIARAVVKDPRILLLDEATSALDAESERVVQEALDNLMKGRTTVVVAHRLSTVRDADSIAVVYKGRIVEQGTHTELVAKGGSYARLVAHQMKKGL